MLKVLQEKAQTCEIDCASLSDEEITQEAANWARGIKTQLANTVIDLAKNPKEETPVSIFMAGTPGAGKTEWRTNFFKQLPMKMVHIDPDDFRCLLPCYLGSNSHLFQRATSSLTERVLDRAFEKSVSFVLDGTLSSVPTASRNLARSLDKGRGVQIYFIHQDPLQSWKFVQAREKIEGRRITPDAFVNSYVGCHETILHLLTCDEFSNAIKNKDLQLDVFIKPSAPDRKAVWRSNVSAPEFKGMFGPRFTAEELHAKIETPTS